MAMRSPISTAPMRDGVPSDADIAGLAGHRTAWRGPDMARRRDEWTLDWHDDLDALASEVRRRLLDGPGFVVVRDAPHVAAAAGAHDEPGACLLDLASRIGGLRSQNAAGDLLGQVRDVGLDAADPNVRIYQTNERQTFHTDSTDAVGLLCLRTAAEGGSSLLASAATSLLELRSRSPKLMPWLFTPVATDRRGETPPGADPWFEIPVLSWLDGHLTPLYQRQYIDSAARFDDAPPLHDDHRAALDAFDEVLDDPEIHLAMDLEPGDLQFVHNHSLLHDRTAFKDHASAPRHLLRVWLTLDGDRRLPTSFEQRYGSIEIGNRGGIVVDDTAP